MSSANGSCSDSKDPKRNSQTRSVPLEKFLGESKTETPFDALSAGQKSGADKIKGTGDGKKRL